MELLNVFQFLFLGITSSVVGLSIFSKTAEIKKYKSIIKKKKKKKNSIASKS